MSGILNTLEKSKERVAVVTLGCEKNTVDSEVLLGGVKNLGFDITEDSENADTIILNTCGFIDNAKQESINSILEALDQKRQGKIKRVFVSGCLSERYRSELEAEMPDVDAFFGTQDFERILTELSGKPLSGPMFELLGERVRSTPRHYAFMKISEGCDNPCSFCAIPIMRGGHRSRSIEELEFEAMMLASSGVKELILIAQDSTYYGLDLYGSRSLAKLLQRLAQVNGLEWIRLMYAYPAKFPKDILSVIAGEEKIVKYLDIPVQHASTNVLKSMRRGITRNATEDLIGHIREQVPGIALRTTLICGYPAEDEREFEELESFVETMQFDRLGVFTYSQEDGTTAHPLGDPIPQSVKLERQRRLLDLQREISYDKNCALVGKALSVLIESHADNKYVGRSFRDAPEIDNSVLVSMPSSGSLTVGEFSRVRVTAAQDFDLEAILVDA